MLHLGQTGSASSVSSTCSMDTSWSSSFSKTFGDSASSSSSTLFSKLLLKSAGLRSSTIKSCGWISTFGFFAGLPRPRGEGDAVVGEDLAFTKTAGVDPLLFLPFCTTVFCKRFRLEEEPPGLRLLVILEESHQ